MSKALNVVIADTHEQAWAEGREFMLARGMDLDTLDEATLEMVMSLIVLGDADEVGEQITDILALGVDGITCSLPANGHIPGRVELLGATASRALGI